MSFAAHAYAGSFFQWGALEAVAAAGVVLALMFRRTRRPLAAGSALAMAGAVAAVSAALRVSANERSLLCVSAAVALPLFLSALLRRGKNSLPAFVCGVSGAIGAVILLFQGRLVSPAWLGVAVLILVPFLATGWLMSRLWCYATAAAVALSLGLLLPSFEVFGAGRQIMLASSALCVLFLHVNLRTGERNGGIAVSIVSHALAALCLLLLYILVDKAGGRHVAPGLLIVAAGYFSVGRHSSHHMSTAYLFFSLSLLPLSAFFFGGAPVDSILLHAFLVPVWAIIGMRQRGTMRASCCRASALLALTLCVIGATKVSVGTGPLFLLCLAGILLCLVVQRERFFVNLVLLLLAAMGYAWIHAAFVHVHADHTRTDDGRRAFSLSPDVSRSIYPIALCPPFHLARRGVRRRVRGHDFAALCELFYTCRDGTSFVLQVMPQHG